MRHYYMSSALYAGSSVFDHLDGSPRILIGFNLLLISRSHDFILRNIFLQFDNLMLQLTQQ